MGVEDKYPGYTYRKYKENHPVHQFNSGNTNSHVRINGTVYLDDGTGPVPEQMDDYDKLNNETFQTMMSNKGVPTPVYLKDLNYGGYEPFGTDAAKILDVLFDSTTDLNTLQCTWSVSGDDDERIIFVNPLKANGQYGTEVSFVLGGKLYKIDKDSTHNHYILNVTDLGYVPEDNDYQIKEAYEEYTNMYDSIGPLNAVDWNDAEFNIGTQEYNLAVMLKDKYFNHNRFSIRIPWDYFYWYTFDQQLPLLTDVSKTDINSDHIQYSFVIGGYLYTMDWYLDLNKVVTHNEPITNDEDYDKQIYDLQQDFAVSFGLPTPFLLGRFDYTTDKNNLTPEYKFFKYMLDNGTVGDTSQKLVWDRRDVFYDFVNPSKIDDNIISFEYGGMLYDAIYDEVNDVFKMQTRSIYNSFKLNDDYDKIVDDKFQNDMVSASIIAPVYIGRFNYASTQDVNSREYKVAQYLYGEFEAGRGYRKVPFDKHDEEETFVNPTYYEDADTGLKYIKYVIGGNLYTMEIEDGIGVTLSYVPIKIGSSTDYDKLVDDAFQQAIMGIGLTGPIYMGNLPYENNAYYGNQPENVLANWLWNTYNTRSGKVKIPWVKNGENEYIFITPEFVTEDETTHYIQWSINSSRYKILLGGNPATGMDSTYYIDTLASDYDYDYITKYDGWWTDVLDSVEAGYGSVFNLDMFGWDDVWYDDATFYAIDKAIADNMYIGEAYNLPYSTQDWIDDGIPMGMAMKNDYDESGKSYSSIKFVMGGYLHEILINRTDNKYKHSKKALGESNQDLDITTNEYLQSVLVSQGLSETYLHDFNWAVDTTYGPGTYEYKLTALLSQMLTGASFNIPWDKSDNPKSFVFVHPLTEIYTDSSGHSIKDIKFTLGGRLYTMKFDTTANNVKFIRELINDVDPDYDVFVDEEFKSLLNTVGVVLPSGLSDLNFNTTADVFSDEYKVADLLLTILKNGDPVRCTWSVKAPYDKEYIFVDPTLTDDNTIHFTYGGNLYEMITNNVTGVVTKTYPIKEYLKHESDYWMEAYEELTTTAPELKSLCAVNGTCYEEGDPQYDILKILYDECMANGNMKALYSYVTLSDGTAERLMCDVTASVNNTLWVNYGNDLIRAKFMDDDGNYILLNCYDVAEENSLYNNWFQKWYYEIDSDDHNDQFFILNTFNAASPKHYDKTTQEYKYVTQAFQAFSSREKEIVKFPIGLSTDFEGQNAIICVYAMYYSEIYGDNVVTEIDFEFGHNNYRLIYDMVDEYVCLDRQNKYDSPEKQFDTYMNQAYKNGKCPTVDVEFSDNGAEIEVTSSSDINKLNSLDDYAIDKKSYTLGPSEGDTVVLIPGGGISLQSSLYGLNNKYQINNLYTNLMISCNFKDDTQNVYTWSAGDCLYEMRHDLVNDKWYTKWGRTSTPMYDSEAWYEYFNKVVLNNLRPGTVVNDFNSSGVIKTNDSRFALLEAINTWFDTHLTRSALDAPWDITYNDFQAARFTTCRLFPVTGYEAFNNHHRGILIKRANTKDIVIDYMVDDDGVEFYYVSYYDPILRDAMQNVSSYTGAASYLRPYFTVRPDGVNISETCYLGKIISAPRYDETNRMIVSTSKDPQYFNNIKKIFSKIITGAQFNIMSHNFDGAYIPWEEEDGDTGFVKHGITWAKVNPWGYFDSRTPEDVKDFIVDIPYTNVYYVLRFNDKVVDSTECRIWFGGHASSSDLITLMNWGDACYECGIAQTSTAKYNQTLWYLTGFTYSTSKVTVTDPETVKFFKVVSVAAQKSRKQRSEETFVSAFNGLYSRSNENALDKSFPVEYVFVPILMVDTNFTEFRWTIGGRTFYVKLDAPGLSATQAEVWYKEL